MQGTLTKYVNIARRLSTNVKRWLLGNLSPLVRLMSSATRQRAKQIRSRLQYSPSFETVLHE